MCGVGGSGGGVSPGLTLDVLHPLTRSCGRDALYASTWVPDFSVECAYDVGQTI